MVNPNTKLRQSLLVAVPAYVKSGNNLLRVGCTIYVHLDTVTAVILGPGLVVCCCV